MCERQSDRFMISVSSDDESVRTDRVVVRKDLVLNSSLAGR